MNCNPVCAATTGFLQFTHPSELSEPTRIFLLRWAIRSLDSRLQSSSRFGCYASGQGEDAMKRDFLVAAKIMLLIVWPGMVVMFLVLLHANPR